MIRKMNEGDMPRCAEILCEAYNNEMWQCHWTAQTATAYLMDYFRAEKFVGLVLEEDSDIIGALFAHEKIWWNNSELYVDEVFITPVKQRGGYGSALLKAAEQYSAEHGLAGLTLCTNKYAPARDFYRKNGFSDNEYIVFMYKEQ